MPSIIEHGILSHYDSAGIQHETVADPEVQERRATRAIPGGLRLHRYANLYFNARNAMMYTILRSPDSSFRQPAETLSAIRVSLSVLDLAGVVITDINAAAEEQPRWYTVDDGLARLNRDELFALSWDHSDYWEKRRRKQRMMAEVLVPRRVPSSYISGAYVTSAVAATALAQVAPTLESELNPYLFFEGTSA